MVEEFILFAAAILVLCTIAFIVKNTVWFHVRNLWNNIFLQPQSLSKNRKKYVRIVKKDPKPTEIIKEIKGEELEITINDKGELVLEDGPRSNEKWYRIKFDAETEQDDDGLYLKLTRPGENTPTTIYNNTVEERDFNIDNKTIHLVFVYVNIQIYGKA